MEGYKSIFCNISSYKTHMLPLISNYILILLQMFHILYLCTYLEVEK